MRTLLKRPSVLLSLLYILAYFPSLFQKGIYWDGWMWIPELFTYHNFDWMYAHEFAPLRAEHYYVLFRAFAATPDPILTVKIVIFLSWLGAGLLLFAILDQCLHLGRRTSFLIAAYYLIFPAFITRFEIVSGSYYSTANLAFMLGSYLYLAPEARSQTLTILREATALALFVWSFLSNAFPVFFGAFLAAHFYRHIVSHPSVGVRTAVTTWLQRYFYLPLIDIAYVGIKLFALKPYGIGEHYNQLLITRADLSPLQMLSQFADSFWGGIWAGFVWPIAAALSLLERKYFLLAVAFAVVLITIVFRFFQTLPDDKPLPQHPLTSYVTRRPALSLFVTVGFLFVLGVFPYAMAGKAAHIYGYGFALRLSLLFPLGAAVFFVGIIHTLLREHYRLYAHMGVLALCTAFLWYNSFLEDMDWYKQQAILHELPKIAREIPPPATLIFSDDTRGFNWLNRTIAPQEYSGYFRELTGSTEYHGINSFDWSKSGTTSNATVLIRIVSGRADEPRVPDWIRLKYTELRFGKDETRLEAHNVLQISLVREKVQQTQF